MNLASAVRHFLSSRGIRLNTDLGQHFLIDQDVLDAIVDAADIRPNDHVVEIGPGIGVLTKELVQRTGKVTVIELDERMIPLLQSFLKEQFSIINSQLSIIQGNALSVAMPHPPYKVVANIPYHITSPLLRHLCLESAPPQSMTLLIQKEVAEKICDNEHAGLLTIVVGLFGTPKIVRHVPAASFLPPPKVTSSVLHIGCFAEPIADAATIDRVLKLAKHAFAQKRKMLRNTFGSLENGLAMLEKAGIDPQRRPETLTVEEWITVAEAT